MLEAAKLLVCVGPGGVGKTTTAAVLALRAAQAGQRTLVLTIDPARRLATCLGLEELNHHPQRVELPDAANAGTMWAMMLDTRQMFDELIAKLAPDEQTTTRILKSRVYGIFASSMHGTAEYMALESLHSTYMSGDFDLVVLDTPPLTSALDFFKVPNRASWVFDERIMRWFVPSKKGPRGLRARFNPGALAMRLLKRLAGESLVNDIAEFFSALDVLKEALKVRGDEVGEILRASDTTYFVVTAATPRHIEEALHLEDELQALGQRAERFLVNRSHASFVGAERTGTAELLSGLLNGAVLDDGDIAGVQRAGLALAASGRRHQQQLESLEAVIGTQRVIEVPDFDDALEDLRRLSHLGDLIAQKQTP